MKNLRNIAAALCLGAASLLAAPSHAGNIAIINGATGTSESGTTSSITTQLNNLLIAAGHTTTIFDAVPASFAGFSQVWDIRFSNTFGLSPAQLTQYVSYLSGGGGMFVMGENSGFMTRNNSVLSLISQAGGGSLAFTTPASTQTVHPPFTGPNVIVDNDVVYLAPGGVTSAGTGQFITSDGSGNGTGIAFSVGDLANAAAGSLAVIFDVNFMQTDAYADSQNLLRNLIGFVAQQVEPPSGVPEPGMLLLVGIALSGLALTRRRHA